MAKKKDYNTFFTQKHQMEADKEREWKAEIKRRIKFGISTDTFNPKFGAAIRYCEIRFSDDFEYLGYFYDARRKTKKNSRDLIVESFDKYKEYTFKQLDEAGGALPLSKVCGFVQVLFKQKIVFSDTKVKIIYRQKDAVKTGDYPDKVREIFRENKNCKAIACLYQDPVVRVVIVEKKR